MSGLKICFCIFTCLILLLTRVFQVFELEEKLKTCEASLQELRQAREHVVKQEREWTHRQVNRRTGS